MLPVYPIQHSHSFPYRPVLLSLFFTHKVYPYAVPDKPLCFLYISSYGVG